MSIAIRFGFVFTLLCGAVPAFAQVVVPANASLQLNGGKLDLGGGDIDVAGSVGLGGGVLDNVGSLSILAGGLFDAGSGLINLSGNWSNLGSFAAGTGTVDFIDGGRAQSLLAGATHFNTANFISVTGKNYVLPVGLTQTFSGALTILGTASIAVQFRSAVPGGVANVDLLAGGTQNIHNVGVSNVHATGQHLAPDETNRGGAGDDMGWFGAQVAAAAVVPAPMLDEFAMLLLAFGTVLATAHARGRVPFRRIRPI